MDTILMDTIPIQVIIDLLDELNDAMTIIENGSEVGLHLSYLDICFIKHCIVSYVKESEV